MPTTVRNRSDPGSQRPWVVLPTLPPDVVALTVLAEPVSKARARVTRGGGSYTPAPTRDAEALWRLAIRQCFPRLPVDADHCFGVLINFYTGSWRLDVDNMAKLILDACNGLVWHDDVQIGELRVRAFRADPRPRTELVISHMDLVAPPGTRCRRCKGDMPLFPSWQQRKYCSDQCELAARRPRATA